jgi:glycosyltransferase involved in cell wall biosynthesis
VGRRDDVPEILTALDVFALASSVETFGLAVAEALVAGVPTVATRVGGVPEIVGADFAHHLVPAGDVASLQNGVRQALDDPEGARRAALGAGASIRARFALPVVAESVHELYVDVLRAREPRV